ncbi:uncharacterized protein METZ01_LOCUS71558 [marine metagenome]|uniref:Uncharacterized protein n=1 Tax=marine metagenome TaxID=408172 RepID=A0A381TS79_9ZZZZ
MGIYTIDVKSLGYRNDEECGKI